ncbi:MAG: DsbA family protein [Bifidobacteriaceae bacterium]|jgi:protein-disulfide isomerase|nr:DsbA family protein [Bifidobacteriaceae bacterium]
MIQIPGITVGPEGKALSGAAAKTETTTRVDAFVDYMCPYCRHFERDNGAELQALVDRGITSLVMHPISILDRLSLGTMYSTRAAAAAYAVAAGSPEHFGAFNSALCRDQPREGTEGLSDADLAHLAESIGVEKAVTHTFADPKFISMVEDATNLAINGGLQGTPTVLLTGHHRQTFQWDGSESIGEALGSMAAR